MQRHIYRLTNTANDRVYFGETTTKKLVAHEGAHRYAGFVIRHAEHLSALEAGRHYNEHMQADYDAARTHWTFEVIQTLGIGATHKEALAAEKAWVLATPDCYNIRHKPGSRRGITLMSDAEIDEIKAYAAMGYNGMQVARLTGRSTGSVSLVLSKKRREVTV